MPAFYTHFSIRGKTWFSFINAIPQKRERKTYHLRDVKYCALWYMYLYHNRASRSASWGHMWFLDAPHERTGLMDAQFPDQRNDHTSPAEKAKEGSDISTVVAEEADTTVQVQSASSGDTAKSASSLLRTGLHTIISQDYIGVLTATVVLIIII